MNAQAIADDDGSVQGIQPGTRQSTMNPLPGLPHVTPLGRQFRPLTIETVTVRFGSITALSEVSLRVSPGSVHAVIGPNGAGKSTLFNAISGVYRVASGQIRLGSEVLTRMRPHQIAALGVGRAFQNIALSGAETVADNIMAGRHPLMRTGFLASGLRLPSARFAERVHRERVVEIAEFLGLGRLLGLPVAGLSYGDRKRVEVARALAGEPTLLLLDEPVAGMNAHEKHSMSVMIRKIRDALGVTVLLVEHDMTMVMTIADQVSVLDFGRLIADGAPQRVQTDPAVVRAYLGAGDGQAAERISAAIRAHGEPVVADPASAPSSRKAAQ
ncbi:branched-chain amino acid transport system ATP-binding protein [Frankia sp. Hr75.2]|nr:branched-chain amino acid transport system ATP-binding protein [Frankia sp. Hr75.2]